MKFLIMFASFILRSISKHAQNLLVGIMTLTSLLLAKIAV